MQNLLEVDGLKTYFFTRRGIARAVDGVSFALRHGQTLGLVGESGCGKSITCRSLLRLVPQPAGRIVGGRVLFEGEDLLQKSESEMRRIRGRKVSMILQDPMRALNPVFSVSDQVKEPLRIHQGLHGGALWDKAVEMLKMVRIASPETCLRSFPHQLSGGMRQRVVGAMALSCQPALLIADEATTSLDTTIQAQYLSLLKEIQQVTGMALIFVTHDFGIVAEMCDLVVVMYAGRVVEEAPVEELFDNPKHPYTVGLMKSLPRLEEKTERLATIDGQPPSLYELPSGCSFFPRCSSSTQKCEVEVPRQLEIGPGHRISCWHYGN